MKCKNLRFKCLLSELSALVVIRLFSVSPMLLSKQMCGFFVPWTDYSKKEPTIGHDGSRKKRVNTRLLAIRSV